ARAAGSGRLLPLCPEPVAGPGLSDHVGGSARRSPSPALSAAALSVVDVRHRYGERVALDGVSFAVGPGELFALLGPNGGGKSTLFRILSTLERVQEGSASVLGHDVTREPASVRRSLGVVFQHPSVDGLLTVEENLVHHGHLHGLGARAVQARRE